MNITILDAYTLNPGDLPLTPLEKLGRLTTYDRTKPEEVIERAKDAEIILSNKVVLNKEIIQQLPKLKYIGVLATGYNVIDTQTAKAQNIIVTNIPAYSSPSVAQHFFALLLAFTNQVEAHNKAVHAGQWQNCQDFCFTLETLTELEGQTLGIVGYGDIAQRIIKIASALGMKILVHTRTVPTQAPDALRFVSREELFKNSDYISLNCPLTDSTKHMINKDAIEIMKSNCVLINTGRGPLINEQDLANALKENRIKGAALDVLEQEPPTKGSPLIGLENCIITPHIAWASLSARKRLLQTATENIKNFLNGNPKNVVNP